MRLTVCCLTTLFVLLGAAEAPPQSVRLSWPPQPHCRYTLHLHLRPDSGIQGHPGPGRKIPNVLNCNEIDSEAGVEFTGRCLNHPDLAPLPLTAIDRFELVMHGPHQASAIEEFAGQDRITFRFPIILRWNALDAAAYQLNAIDAAGKVCWEKALGTEKLYTIIFLEQLQNVVNLRLKALDQAQRLFDTATCAITPEASEYRFDFLKSPYHGVERRLLKAGLADPVLIRGHDAFLLSGTHWADTCRIPLLATENLDAPLDQAGFNLRTEFAPNDKGGNGYDPRYAYYYCWAPELTWNGTRYRLYFSARRVARLEEGGLPGAPPLDDQVTLFYADAGPDLCFSAPVPFDSGQPGAPRHTADLSEGPYSGTPFQIKIDSAWLEDATPPRLFYTWFHAGNHIASFAPAIGKDSLVRHLNATLRDHEMILEAPYPVHHHGRYYLFYSSGHFNCSYATHYLMGGAIESLTPETAPPKPLLDYIAYPKTHRAPSPYPSFGHTPLGDKNRYLSHKLLENAGHCGVLIENDDRAWVVYHVGGFNEGLWRGRRDTFLSPLHFCPDGRIYPIGF